MPCASPESGGGKRRARLLLASTSLAALLVGGGMSSAFACYTGPFPHTNTGTTACITVSTSFSGTLGNTGTISPGPTGIAIVNGSTISGEISDSGTISASSHGILIDSASQINNKTAAAIYIDSAPTFSGGISSAGTISAGSDGIYIYGVSTFTGNISNSGTITAKTAIYIIGSTIAGAIIDSGTILATSHGIAIDSASEITSGSAAGVWVGGNARVASGYASAATVTISTFSGGISNSGTISAGGAGIWVGGSAIVGGGSYNTASVTISTFSGGVSNSGTISAIGAGVWVGGNASVGGYGNTATATISTFSGGISSAGTISAGAAAIWVGGSASVGDYQFNIATVTISTFSGGVSNSGKISAIGVGVWVGGDASAASGYASTATVTISTFTGGISNSGTISAGGAGIWVGGSAGAGVGGGVGGTEFNSATVTISMFSDGVTNSGTISAGGAGIWVGGSASIGSGVISSASVTISMFSSGISNSGTIAAGSAGIWVGGSAGVGGGDVSTAAMTISTFSGGISNSGTISAGGAGIRVGGDATVSLYLDAATVTISTFSGRVTNSGTIAAGGAGIWVGGSASADGIPGGAETVTISTFSGGISNSGTISAGDAGIWVGGSASVSGGSYNTASVTISTFSGGISNSGTISAGGAGIWVGGSASVGGGSNNTASVTISTFSGGITNSGLIVAKTGIVVDAHVLTFGGPIVNSGTISGAGGTAIDVSGANNTITIDQIGGLISGGIKLSAYADQLNISGGTIAGNIVGQGPDDINFALGTGTFTYANTYGFSNINQVNINSGTILLNGSNSASNVNVFGGTLGGTGTLDPLTLTIHSGATFSPGTPGVAGTSMAITGTLAFQSGALYVIYLNPSTSSFANVSGTASLAGTVNANFAAGSYAAKQYTILETMGGLAGTTFSGLTTNLPNFDASLSYSGDDVFLNLTAALGTGTPLTVNESNVATAINNYFNTVGELPPNFVSIFGLIGGALGNALTQLDGEDATGAETSSFQLMNEFLSLLGEQGFGDGAGNAGQVFDYAPLPAKALPSTPATFDQPWHAWGAGFGGGSFADGNTTIGSTNLTTTTYGYAGGMDYRPDPDTLYGFALAGGGLNWGLANALGTGRSDSFQAGAYGRHYVGPAYIEGALAFGNNWFATSRNALGEQLTASFQGQSYGLRLEGGYRYALSATGALGVTPYAALQTQWFHTPAYSESGGALALAYNSQTANDTRTELGARFDDLSTMNATPLILRARLAWAHDFVSNPALGAAFESLPGSIFTVNGAPIPHDSALTSASAQWLFTPNWSLTAKFDGEFASSAQTYAGTGTLRYTW